MKDLGITKGEWWPCCKDTRPHFIFVGEEDKVVCSVSSNEKGTDDYEPMMAEVSITERIANAALIADAGNTAQKCGLLPSELLKQRDDAVDKVETLVGYLSIMALGKTPPELEAVIKEANEWIEITKAEER